MKEYREIILTQGSINHGYLSVDKYFFPQDTWGHSKDKKVGRKFKLIIDDSENYDTDYDLYHNFIRKRFKKFFDENGLQANDVLYLYKVADYEYTLMPTKINPIEDIVNNDVISMQSEETFGEEGGKKARYVNYYERNIQNRVKAIEIHGLHCKACGFNFSGFYGDRGSDFIEVHHIKPVSDMVEKRIINIEEDMTVLCSNCHRMVHREKDNVLTVDELKEIIEKNKNL